MHCSRGVVRRLVQRPLAWPVSLASSSLRAFAGPARKDGHLSGTPGSSSSYVDPLKMLDPSAQTNRDLLKPGSPEMDEEMRKNYNDFVRPPTARLKRPSDPVYGDRVANYEFLPNTFRKTTDDPSWIGMYTSAQFWEFGMHASEIYRFEKDTLHVDPELAKRVKAPFQLTMTEEEMHSLPETQRSGVKAFMHILNNNPHFTEEEKRYMFENLFKVLRMEETPLIRELAKQMFAEEGSRLGGGRSSSVGERMTAEGVGGDVGVAEEEEEEEEEEEDIEEVIRRTRKAFEKASRTEEALERKRKEREDSGEALGAAELAAYEAELERAEEAAAAAEARAAEAKDGASRARARIRAKEKEQEEKGTLEWEEKRETGYADAFREMGRTRKKEQQDHKRQSRIKALREAMTENKPRGK